MVGKKKITTTKIGFCQPGMGWSWPQLRDFWVEGEKLGFDSGTMMDNLIYTGPPNDAVRPTFETWSVLPALAEVTSRIRIGPQVTPCLRRAPALFAKMTTQVDHISDGRVYLGLGVGDMPKYHLPWGMPFPAKISERAKILREEIAVMKLMWNEDKANFQGNYYHLDDAEMIPKPIQKGGPPLYLGLAFGAKLMPRLAVELCDGVLLYNGSDRAVEDLLEIIKGFCEEAGRDFSSFYKGLTVNVHLLDNEDDRGYLDLEAEGYIFPSLPDGAPPRELIPEWNTVTLAEQHAFMKVLFASGELLDECNMGLPEGVVPPREGYNMTSMPNRFVIGTSEQVVEELTQIAEMGLDEIYIQGLDSLEELQKFGTEVLPKLRGG